LVTLNLSGCRLVSDLGLRVLVTACGHLRDLDISRCSHGISSVGVEKLTALTRLTRLSLAECERVTSDAVAALGTAQLPLQLLDVSACRQVTDAAVAVIGRQLQRLQHLRLSYCCQVTNLGVRHLLQLRELEELDLVGTLYKRTPATEKLHRQVERVHYEENSGLLWLL
jgi:F-box/leucine-rich repeat protein 2/20